MSKILNNNINEKIEIKNIYPLSPMQEGMLFHYLLDKNSKAYFEQQVLTFEGKLDINIFEKSFNYIVDRYDILRTVFEYEKFKKTMQVVIKNRAVKVSYRDISYFIDKEKYIEDFIDEDRCNGFDLRKDVLIRIAILKIDESVYKVIWSFHHILMDGWCNGIIINDIFKVYHSLLNQESINLGITYSYMDYINWLKNQNKEEGIRHWETYLKGYSNEISILGIKDEKVIGERSRSSNFKISENNTREITRIAYEMNSTVSTVLHAMWGILLQKHNNTNDVVFGTVVSGRNGKIEGIENMVGLFINTIPIRIRCDENTSFLELLTNLQNELIESNKYDYIPLAEIQSLSELKQRLINSIMIFENYPMVTEMKNLSDSKNLGFVITDVETHELTNYNFNVMICPGNEIIIKFSYNENMYDKDSIARTQSHFEKIIESIVENNNILIRDIDILSESEKYKLLYEFNDTYAEYPREKTIYELFEEQVAKTPDNIAVVYEDRRLTYKELNEKSNKLARTLREKEIKTDSIVGIMVERSLEMIVGIMAILKSGGAYLPIDPQYPQERIEYLLQDSETKLLLTQEHLLKKVEFDGVKLNIQDEHVYSDNVDNLGKTSTSKDLAYVIYTSGSTGNPKGVMVEHYSVINRLIWMQKRYPINIDDIILQKTTYTFDVSVWELIWWSLVGASVCLLPQEGEKDLQLITKTIECNKITVMHFVPSMLNIFIDYFEREGNVERIRTLKQVFSSGEALTLNQVKRFNEIFYKNYGIKLCNLYGPTEATVDVSFFNCSTLDNLEIVSIGKPIDNIKLYILDEKMNIQPIGIPGQLCISGDGLARGYINKPELTVEKFVENPFVSGEKMYKTGDLARWMPDGNIEFLGRIDHQVKIRGFRIELGEIESQLLNHEDIKELIVIDREDGNGSKYLCAFLVAEKKLTVGELREYLSKNLPDYMIPSYFMQLDKMPLTSNGKIDRKALPEIDGIIVTGIEYEAPRNEIEEKLAAIWGEILGIDKLGINDNFFALGGHSLKVTTLVSKIHRELNTEVPLREIFKFPTIKGISEYMKGTEKRLYSSIEIVEEKEYYEASAAQKRMYMLQQFDLGSTGYNMPGVMMVEGKLDVEKLEKSFIELIGRHENLRTSFETVEDKIVQRVNESVNFKLDCFEVECIESKDKAVDNIIKDFVQAFDLNTAPLLRVGLIKLEDEKYILMFDMHHIISDGVSMRILTNEFTKIYEGNKLEQIRIQYKDYSQWQNSLLRSGAMQEQKQYWINRFKDEIPVLNMRADFQRPLMQSFEGENISFELDKELTKKLKRISKETGSTMYMLLLSGVNILLSKYSGQEDIIIGSPIAGRPHADLEKIIGMFVNTIAMRNHPEGSKTYEDFLKEVKENALKAYENQDYQFDELVNKLNIPRDMSRNPLFDVMFTMQNLDFDNIELKDLIFKGYKQEHKVAKFDLTFSASETVENIILNIQYSTKLYKRETIERMIEHFESILKVVVMDTKIRLSEIDMLTEEERHKLLYEFNDTYVDYPRDKTMHELFEEQVEKTPNNVAVVFEDKNLTYRELNEKANRLARTLREKGVKPDSIVGMMLNRSLEMIVGMFGILKSGGAYLPIDPEYPEERIGYMIEESNTNILLTQSSLINRVEFHGEVIDLEDERVYSQNSDNLEKANKSRDLAYVIYTSGSTGKPKGVMIEHRSIATTLQWRKEQYRLNSDDSILQLFSNAFDGFVTSFYTPMISGSKLVILNDSDAKDVFKIRENILRNKITHFITVPSMCLAIIQNLTSEDAKSLRIITLAGENLAANIVEKCKTLREELEVVNEYGPTENSVVATIMRDVRKDKQITIGKPKANTRIYIVDKKNKLQSIGVPGEICISGEGLARGYLNKLELTEEKFIESPFVPGERMYKTGDLARWLIDGTIEFLGRIDHQVKIRGFRIELGEIESQLLNNESVKEVIVLDREDENGSKYLCAYLVSEKELTVGELRSHISKKLPEYMIPSYFVQLERMPLTLNGKINRKALPEPDGSIVTGTEYEAPRNEVEEKLAVIWGEVLGVESVGINDNFFEQGGHSLKATTLISRIHKEFNIQIGLSNLFSSPTIAQINELIKNSKISVYGDIKRLQQQEYYELSYAQKRLWIINQLKPNSTAYNMPNRITLFEEVDESLIKKVFDNLTNRHEAFRTMFKKIDGNPVQIINDKVDFHIDTDDLSQINDIEQMERREQIFVEQATKIFDLEVSPLIYVKLVKIKEKEYDMIFSMHHIISDGGSMEILKKEFALIYNAYKQGEECKLEPLKIQYKDFASWQNQLIQDEVNIKPAKDFWCSQLSGELQALNLPFSYEPSSLNNNNSAGYKIIIKDNYKNKLKDLAREHNTSLFVVMLTTFKFFLADLTGQKDILIGTAGFGRNHEDLKNVIGYFINTTILRNEISLEESFVDLLKRINVNVLRALEYQNYPVELIIDELKISYPKISTFFNMLNMGESNSEYIKDLETYHIEKVQDVKFDIVWYVTEYANGIEIMCNYLLELFKPLRIESIMNRYLKTLEVILENPNKLLKEFKIVTKKRKI